MGLEVSRASWSNVSARNSWERVRARRALLGVSRYVCMYVLLLPPPPNILRPVLIDMI